MTDKDRLIELIKNCFFEFFGATVKMELIEYIADNLLANGVIVLPCKVGDYARYKYNGAEAIWKIISISFYAEGQPQVSLTHGKVTNTLSLAFFEDRFVIIPKEEAEAELEKRGKENEC